MEFPRKLFSARNRSGGFFVLLSKEAASAAGETERGRVHDGRQRDHRPVLGPGPAGHRRDRREIRRLSADRGLEHPAQPRRRRGVRQRHIPADLERHSPGPARGFPGLAGADHPEPEPGPLETGPGGAPGRGRLRRAAGGTGRMPARRRPRPAAPGGPGDRGSDQPLSPAAVGLQPPGLPAAVLVRRVHRGDRRRSGLRRGQGEVRPVPHPQRPASLPGARGVEV